MIDGFGKIKENLADGLTLEEAIQDAIEYGIEHDVMKEFLEANGSEVANMLLSGWNMDEALAVSKEEGFEDGLELGLTRGMAVGKAEGAAQERAQNIRALKDILSIEKIAETFNVTQEYVLDILNSDDTTYSGEPTSPYNNKTE